MKARKKPYNPARYLIGGFIAVILAGSLLLSLPAATKGGEIAYLDALFTAASAVCVTGLVVVDTGTFYTSFGQTVIMLLIFIGSLGFMTMATLAFIFLGRRISLRDRLVVREALNQESISGLLPMVMAIARMALLFVISGAALLAIRFVPLMGWAEGLFFSLFHSVSAFGNAGFDLFGNYISLTGNPTDYLVNGTIMGLLIIGGLGFPVIFDLVKCGRKGCRLTLHTRMVLIISAVLLLAGTGAILALEYNNPSTMASLAPGDKIFTALFTAATPRTAGFNVLNTGSHFPATLFIMMALMFIGASPGSTGGGVKTTTFGTVVIAVVALIGGRCEPVLFQRRLPLEQIFKAVAIIGGAATLVFATTLVLTIFEKQPFIELLFEAFSAFGTVGLSTGITPDLSAPSKVALIVAMFGGRLGPLTLVLALTRQKCDDGLHYPEERLIIG